MTYDLTCLSRQLLINIKLFFFLIILNTGLQAQSWIEVQQYGSPDNESCEVLTTDREGNLYFSGGFNESLDLGDESLQSNGDIDIFLVKRNEDGMVEWVVQGSSTDNDEAIALATDEMEHIYWTGHYWREGFFGDTILTVNNSAKGIFLSKYNSSGEWVWAKSIDGTGLKQVSDICISEDAIYCTGYFEGSLIIEDSILQGESAINAFLIKMNLNGELIWARQAGDKGQTRGISLAIDSEQNIILGGHFVGQSTFGNTTLETGTPDWDVFISKWDTQGELIWAKRAGGVFDSENGAVVLDEGNNIYLTGKFLGVMKLGNDIEIQTEGFNQQFYLLKYQTDGTPLWAKVFSTTGQTEAKDMIINNSQIVLTGDIRGHTTIGDYSLASSSEILNGINGFAAGFSLDGEVEWAKNLQSHHLLLATSISSSPNGNLFIGGSFLENAIVGETTVESEGAYDAFVAQLQPASTLTFEPLEDEFVSLFPNLTKDFIFFEKSVNHFTLKTVTINGNILGEYQSPNLVDVRSFDAGIYFFIFESEERRFTKKFIVIKD